MKANILFGDKLLRPDLELQTKAVCFGAKCSFFEWLEFNIPIQNLPFDCRISFEVVVHD